MSTPELHQAIAASEWFRELPAELVGQLAALAQQRHLADGALLFAKGDAADGLYGLLSGRVRISATTRDGRDLLVNLFEPGDWFGEISMFDGLPRTHDARAVGASELLLIPRARFHALLAAQPVLYPHFMRMLCRKLRRSFAWIEYIAFLPMSARLAARLLELAQDYGETQADGSVLIALHLPQEELGRMLSVSRQTVSKELNALEARGWIRLDYGRVLIRQPEALEALVRGAA
ncbi:Crp/Fnr family transcriptional regulator [Stagnimonas aquatica]|uniref:Crp/Fnr family transcriptional regulator n=1 Tax=Stagnimonas aquatica TaxID=2689987 RepID=A0A3N0V1U7_9GAMM|nr:Crp/Fnr family transcriptional regulator [Stagnimonas aquatica]ROH86777.1 Crp/Fnr family transcriptional regulator [Stagnimonas aquatica]